MAGIFDSIPVITLIMFVIGIVGIFAYEKLRSQDSEKSQLSDSEKSQSTDSETHLHRNLKKHRSKKSKQSNS